MSQILRVVRFGLFEVDTRTGELRKDGIKIKLQEKPFQLLLLLLEHQGDIVTREELRQALWPGDTFVDFDHSLGTAIAKLRTALGDSAKNPRFVETVAGRGYRFIASTSSVGQDVALSVPAPSPEVPVPGSTSTSRQRRLVVNIAAGLVVGGLSVALLLGFDIGGVGAWLRRQTIQPVRSLAVLPLENLSRDPSQEYFVDGMTEQLITTLAQLPGVHVISRTSAMQYKGTRKRLPEIARELNVDAVVEGSVLRSGGRVRISAQLVDARTDQHLWAQSYERDLSDVLTLQNSIARSVADEIRVQLTPRQQVELARVRRVIPSAQEAYLRGRYHLNKGDELEIRKSIDDFNEALANDPEDARSYAGLAEGFIALTDYYDRPSDTMPRARAAAQRALKLDDRLSSAHASLGAVRFLYDWDWQGAEAELKRASELNEASADAHVWYGTFLAQMGRPEEALLEIKRAEALDPLSVAVHLNAGWVFFLLRKNDLAIEQWRKGLGLAPNLGAIHTSIWAAYAQKRETGRIVPPVKEEAGDTSPMDLATLAGVYAMSGKRTEAEHVLARLKALSERRYVCPYEIATAHAVLEQPDEAIQWLRKGLDDRSVCMPDIKTDPRLDGLRSDPRFKELLRQVGFTP